MGQPTLLYVEDEDASVLLLETALKEAAIEVHLHRVSDGEEALEFLNRLGLYAHAPTPDLILLDLNLPRKDGIEVLREIRASDVLRKIPTVMFTSSALAMDRRRSLDLGAQEYITKPSTFDRFVEAVKCACAYLPAMGNAAEGAGGAKRT
jgi:CheY-like chemotaxis protein